MERFCIFGLFGASLALFAWRHAGAARETPPASIKADEVPAPPAEQEWRDPATLIGVSYTMGVAEEKPWYLATNPNFRPPLPPRPSAVL